MLRNCVRPMEHESGEKNKQRRVESNESTPVGSDNASDIRTYPEKSSCSPFWLMNCLSQYPAVYYHMENSIEKHDISYVYVLPYLILAYSLTQQRVQIAARRISVNRKTATLRVHVFVATKLEECRYFL